MTPDSVSIPPPQRWNAPFDDSMTDVEVARVLAVEPFASMDRAQFPAPLTLEGIIKNDMRLRRVQPGEIIVRADDYGNSAFLVVRGQVRVIMPGGVSQDLLGRASPAKKSLGTAIAQLWRNSRAPESRDPTRYISLTERGGESPDVDGASGHIETSIVSDQLGDPNSTRTFLQGVPGMLDIRKGTVLGEGEIFGEIAALGRTPRTATVVAVDPTILLEMRWQRMRDIRRCDEAFRRYVETAYRERSLATHLTSTPLFAHLEPPIIRLLVEETVFETYGEFDWHTSYKRFAAEPEEQRLQREPLIVDQGGYPDGLLLIRSGFARVAQNYHHGLRTLRYLGHGAMFGLEEILAGWQDHSAVPYEHSLRAVGYTDVLRVPTKIIEEHVLPQLSPEQLNALRNSVGMQEKPATRRARPAASANAQALGLPTTLVEGLVDRHFINGRSAMLINLERCVRCDACTQACASGHDNNPRFNRHGHTLDSIMVANACMHCADPVCMIGCPTGAIHRASDAGQVVINDDTCIGCGTCANSCPYNNIRMVEIRDRQGRFILDEVSQAPVRKATKCDLCIDQPGGPACERACPHDALLRIDMGDLPKLAQWLDR
jgi:Fe-S-cluster-containing dehydrogenase component/CRP-like cAMP-binding protein